MSRTWWPFSGNSPAVAAYPAETIEEVCISTSKLVFEPLPQIGSVQPADPEPRLEAVFTSLPRGDQLEAAAGAGGDRLRDGQPEPGAFRLRAAALERVEQAGEQILRHGRPRIGDAQQAVHRQRHADRLGLRAVLQRILDQVPRQDREGIGIDAGDALYSPSRLIFSYLYCLYSIFDINPFILIVGYCILG